MAPSPSSAPRRQRIAWALAIAALFAGAAAAAELHGRASRAPVAPLAELAGGRVAAVPDVVGALHLWQAAGVRGRHLVVLTGRWSRPMRRTPAEAAAPVDANGALFDAARLGISRRLDVVMPPPAFSHRLGEVKGQKALVREEAAFRLHYDGLERRFSTPDGFRAPREQVLVLVEPSWFDHGAPTDPVGWLAARGVTWDLLVFALEDPVADADQRRTAVDVATTAGAVFLELASK